MSVRAVASGEVLVEIDGPVVVVTLNRPEKRNALTQGMYATMADTLDSAQASGEVGAVVVTGNGGAFTAGNDLGDFSSGASLEQTHRFLDAVSTVDVPLVAAVGGVAVGVGVTMLLHFDLVYVEPDARLSVPFASLGLVPEAGSSLLLPRLVGARRASDLLLTGRVIDGSTAAEWGLANAAAAPALDTALDAARTVAAQPPLAARATKRLIREDGQSVPERMHAESKLFGEALGGHEFAEVMAARRDKRAPTFRAG